MIKKALDGLILVVLCIFLFTGCIEQQEQEQINFENIANASKIVLTHYLSDSESTEIIESTDTINDVANWLNELLLDEISFPENETPTDIQEREVYSFSVEENENTINFDYIINDEQACYILYNSKWYVAQNPIVPAFTQKQNIEGNTLK